MATYPFLFMSLLTLTGMSGAVAQNVRLIYVGDPMCSWCYGFSEEITTLRHRYPDVPLELIAGGLRLHGKEHMSDLKAFLKNHWEEVAAQTEAPFRFEILNADLYYDTEPACRALAVFKSFQPESTLAYFKEIQKAFYYENHNPILTENYVQIAAKYQIDPIAFRNKMISEEGILLLQKDLDKARDIKANSFPSVYLEYNGQLYLITKGFSTAESMGDTMDQIIKR